MGDDRGLRHDGGQDRAGPPGAGAARAAASRCGCGGTPASRAVRDTGGTPLTIRPDPRRCAPAAASPTWCWTPGCCRAAPCAAGPDRAGPWPRPARGARATGPSPPAWPSRPGTVRGWNPCSPPVRRAAARHGASAPSWHPAMMSCCPGPRTDELGCRAGAPGGRGAGPRPPPRAGAPLAWRARINVLTRGRLLTMAPGRLSRPAPFPAPRLPADSNHPPKICLESGTLPMWTGTFPTTNNRPKCPVLHRRREHAAKMGILSAGQQPTGITDYLRRFRIRELAAKKELPHCVTSRSLVNGEV